MLEENEQNEQDVRKVYQETQLRNNRLQTQDENIYDNVIFPLLISRRERTTK